MKDWFDELFLAFGFCIGLMLIIWSLAEIMS